MAPTITQSQKQAIIDNLQLEITERARHLRAHYALQCADLRARCERRINRIPTSLRKANMGELFAKHAQVGLTMPTTQSRPATTSPASKASTKTVTGLNHPLPSLPQSTSNKISSPSRLLTAAHPSSTRGRKRKSEEITIASDKENEKHDARTSSNNTGALPVAKNPKRVKTTGPATGPGPASRQVSRTAKQTSVLSPKSHNSRTLPRSPIKDAHVPPKPSQIARPISPQKQPTSPLKSAASAASSALSRITRTAKVKVPAPRTISQSSNSSTSTTVVKKAAPANAPLTKNTVTANKKVVITEPAGGRRVLRKRN